MASSDRSAAQTEYDPNVMTAEEALSWISDSAVDPEWLLQGDLNVKSSTIALPPRGAEWCRTNVMVACRGNGASQWMPWNDSHSLVQACLPSSDVYKIRLFDETLAWQVVSAADACGGYQSNRHQTYKTNDLPLSRIPAVSTKVFDILKQQLLPALAGIFNVSTESVSMREVFVVKYDANGDHAFRGLEMHEDGADYSFNLLLNDPACFDGGGTRFEASGMVLSPQQGEVLVHRGGLRHSGVAITSGQRYVLVGF